MSCALTLRATRVLPSLRSPVPFFAVRDALCVASSEAFRVLHYSVQADHVHLLGEADDGSAFRRGIQGLAIRVAKAVNRALCRRGPVWGDRYHARALRTPREVRNALVYVLNNWRKHLRAAAGLDPCSSARWFDGWRNVVPMATSPPVAAARTWLARLGWRRHGAIGLEERPRTGALPR